MSKRMKRQRVSSIRFKRAVIFNVACNVSVMLILGTLLVGYFLTGGKYLTEYC